MVCWFCFGCWSWRVMLKNHVSSHETSRGKGLKWENNPRKPVSTFLDFNVMSTAQNTNKQTNKQTNRRHGLLHASLETARMLVLYQGWCWSACPFRWKITAVTRGWNGYRNKISTENRPWRRKFCRHSCGDSNPRPFNRGSGALTTDLSPPQLMVNESP